MSRPLRLIAALALATVFAAAPAQQQALVRLTSFPAVSVADGRSTVTISAELRDASGRIVPDGTRVVFNTTLGTFRETVAATVNGMARAVLVAGSSAGIATITATPLSGAAAPATLEYEFVGDRSLLSSAKEYIELVAPGLMHYTVDTRLIGASGPNKSVSVRYRDIVVEADDVQINIAGHEIKARKARLKIGKWTQDFDQLYLQMNLRKGFGVTEYMGKKVQFPVVCGNGIAFAHYGADGELSYGQPPEEKKYGLVEITGPGFTPATSPAIDAYFEMEDLAGSPSRVSAKKAVIFPNKQIQFQKAELYVADSRIMRLPLFQVNLLQNSGPLLTDQLVNVNDNQLAVNYPHYLSLRPGQTSLLRFRTGEAYGRGFGSSRGAFLDYELNWNKGDDMDGGLAVRGIGRSDYSLGLQQYLRIDDRSTAFAQVEMPANRAFFGSGGINRQFDGFQVNLSGSATQSLRGLQYSAQDFQLVAEKDPTKVGKLPVRLFYGLTATSSRNSFLGGSQEAAGVRMRLQSLPLALGPGTNLTTAFSASQLMGQNVNRSGLALAGSASLSTRLTRTTSVVATYDFTRDGFNERFLGQHRVSFQGFMDSGRTNLRLFGTRSLDLDRMNLFGDAEYRISGLWNVRGFYTYDQYLNSNFLDYSFAVGYRLGWREVGLIWSKRTNRIGIQLLGASFN